MENLKDIIADDWRARQRVARQKWNENNKEKMALYRKRWAEKNKEKQRELEKAYRERNKEKIAATRMRTMRDKIYREKNKEKILAKVQMRNAIFRVALEWDGSIASSEKLRRAIQEYKAAGGK